MNVCTYICILYIWVYTGDSVLTHSVLVCTTCSRVILHQGRPFLWVRTHLCSQIQIGTEVHSLCCVHPTLLFSTPPPTHLLECLGIQCPGDTAPHRPCCFVPLYTTLWKWQKPLPRELWDRHSVAEVYFPAPLLPQIPDSWHRSTVRDEKYGSLSW